MTKSVSLEWPVVSVKFNIELMENEEPDMCDMLWKRLDSPLKMFCRHTLSTGGVFMGEGRPPRHPIPSGTQAMPLGRKRYMYSQLKPGCILYAGFGAYGALAMFYGPCTEPLPSPGPVISYVGEKDMEKLVRAGRAVWQAQFYSHEPVTMMVSRVVE